MSTKKRILIVSASIGAGHEQAARSVCAELERNYPAIEVNMVDFMAGDNSYLNKLVKETYLKMIDLTPDMYEFLYRWTQTPWQSGNVRQLLVRAMKRSMYRLIRVYQPDFIICTHPFPCGAAAYLRRKGKLNARIMGIITDFTVHRLWLYDEVDLYCVASEELLEALVRDGIKKERVCITGIPVAFDFNHPINKAKIKEEFGLSENLPTVLVMGGGLGLGNVKETLAELDSSSSAFQTIVVAGRNNDLKESLERIAEHARHRTIVLGYTTRISELMTVADLLITKPGGMTLSEALAMELPMLLCQALPGQEEDNAAYMTGKGAAIWVCDEKELANKVSDVLQDEVKRSEMKESAKMIKRPQASEEIAKVIGRQLLN